MAKPIEPIPTLKGKAERWLTGYLKDRKPEPDKQQRAKEHLEAAKRVKLIRE